MSYTCQKTLFLPINYTNVPEIIHVWQKYPILEKTPHYYRKRRTIVNKAQFLTKKQPILDTKHDTKQNEIIAK